ncbi:DEAD/DEAH box helicase [Erysipelatoclostridium sp. AM42-17]|uniref:DEAD/DEAH box helicase n=1 Tax=Erysipelatoclostridium sp. AM42-17 TaxID=2293102 RepID=UPI000E4ADFC5|nr:DEAD/DEAH box helicase [Erysipelatoclostridium sp. AM42-17]RHS92525.1 ATP-dependent helicase [Erysipelatoclostridium sp. AM42-17]
MNNFTSFHFKEFCYQVIDELGFNKPTPIQEKVIPLINKKRDIIGISQTGTGKTHAFLLPIMNNINTAHDSVQAVITAPTRELASQIYQNAKLFMKYNPQLRVSLIVGGSDRNKAVQKLTTQPHLVIGTPGRIKDLSLEAQALKITTAKIFVVDEADMTLEFGYLEDIDAVAGKMADDLQMMVFSATIPQNLRPFLKKYMKNPETVEINSQLVTTANVEHILLATKHQERYRVLKDIMATIDPYICIIFANRRSEVSTITRRLREDGYKVGEIHGDLEPRERKQMMRRIQNMEYQYIVATDIAARGIDIDGVSHVINMELPMEPNFYIHRSGRCGRGSYTGVCYSMYDSNDEKNIAVLERKGIEFKNVVLKKGQFVDLGEREKRKKRIKQPTELEKQVQMIVRKPKKVKPGYKKKRKREVEQLVRKQKRALIREDIKRQKKERARQAQIAKRAMEED